MAETSLPESLEVLLLATKLRTLRWIIRDWDILLILAPVSGLVRKTSQ
jgi:hypothetical protein